MAHIIELDGVTPTIGDGAHRSADDDRPACDGETWPAARAPEKKPLSGSAEHWVGFAAGEYDRLRARYLRGAAALTHH
jgi:hypothetical protein